MCVCVCVCVCGLCRAQEEKTQEESKSEEVCVCVCVCVCAGAQTYYVMPSLLYLDISMTRTLNLAHLRVTVSSVLSKVVVQVKVYLLPLLPPPPPPSSKVMMMMRKRRRRRPFGWRRRLVSGLFFSSKLWICNKVPLLRS